MFATADVTCAPRQRHPCAAAAPSKCLRIALVRVQAGTAAAKQ